jgi:hypothetical protein
MSKAMSKTAAIKRVTQETELFRRGRDWVMAMWDKDRRVWDERSVGPDWWTARNRMREYRADRLRDLLGLAPRMHPCDSPVGPWYADALSDVQKCERCGTRSPCESIPFMGYSRELCRGCGEAV